MTTGRRLRGILVVATLLLCSPAAHAQINTTIISSTTALTPEQVAAVDEDVRRGVTLLLNSPDDKIGDARTRLLDPFQRGPSDIFKRGYSQSVARELQKAMASDRVIVRINAMIIAARMEDGGVAQLAEKGLTDASPAVRYWSAKAISQGVAVPAEQRAPLLTALTDVMRNETHSEVVEQVLGALVALDAFDRVLGGLNDRVLIHASKPGLSPMADTESLRRLYQKLVQDVAARKTIEPATLRELARASYRFLELAATRLDRKTVADELRGEWRNLVEVSDAALRWSAQTAIPQGKQPDAITADIAAGNWAAVLLRVSDWRPLLGREPLNLKAEDLAVPK